MTEHEKEAYRLFLLPPENSSENENEQKDQLLYLTSLDLKNKN